MLECYVICGQLSYPNLYLGNKIVVILKRVKCIIVQKAANSDIYLSRLSYIKRKK